MFCATIEIEWNQLKLNLVPWLVWPSTEAILWLHKTIKNTMANTPIQPTQSNRWYVAFNTCSMYDDDVDDGDGDDGANVFVCIRHTLRSFFDYFSFCFFVCLLLYTRSWLLIAKQNVSFFHFIGCQSWYLSITWYLPI